MWSPPVACLLFFLTFMYFHMAVLRGHSLSSFQTTCNADNVPKIRERSIFLLITITQYKWLLCLRYICSKVHLYLPHRSDSVNISFQLVKMLYTRGTTQLTMQLQNILDLKKCPSRLSFETSPWQASDKRQNVWYSRRKYRAAFICRSRIRLLKCYRCYLDIHTTNATGK